MKAGLKAIGNVFLMTDGQVADERFLVLINDLLASGEIAELFPDEDVENIINGVRGEVSLWKMLLIVLYSFCQLGKLYKNNIVTKL